MASAKERRRKEVAEKDITIAELTQAVMDQGCDLHTTGKERDEARAELERLRVEMEELKESTRSRTASLAAAEVERDELKGRLQQETKRADELQCLVNIWSRRESTLP